MLLQCTVCSEQIEIKRMLTHMKYVHNSRGIIKVYKCTNISCNRSFDNQRSFRRHILTHKQVTQSIEQSIVDDIELQLNINSTLDVAQATTKHDVVPDLPPADELMKSVVVIVSKFYADSRMSRIQTQRVIDAIREFFNNQYFNALTHFILNSMPFQESKDLVSAAIKTIQQVFSHIDTEYKRLKQFQKYGIFIEPKKILLGYMESKNRAGVLQNKAIFSQFISLGDTLKMFLELPNCYETIQQYRSDLQKNDSIIVNVVQTQFWKERTSQSDSHNIFPLILYQDDFETGNPLGSHSGIYRVSALYATLPCLPQEFRSQVEKIFLVQLCHSDDVKLFGKDVVYREVIKELNLLSSRGIEIKVKDETLTVYFQLILITGDNLGLNSMLGFVENFSASHFCRMCKVSKQRSMSLCTEDKSILRTKDNYEADVAKNNVTLTGIKTRCIWNSVDNFHCAECWSVDAMHDELEGCCKYETAAMLRHFILFEKYFTLDELNFRLKYFRFPANSNVPPLITHDNLKAKQLRMSASEMKCFIMHLGLLIGDLIPQENNPHWRLHKLLRQIVSISLQTFTSPDYTELLTSLIEEHHLLHLSIFGNTLKPKHHIMLHYPTVMKRIGPLRHVWSMRCEAKHQVLKQIASVSASRVNICRTIAIKSQLKFGNMLLQGDPFTENIKYRPLKAHLPISTEVTKCSSGNLSSYTQVKLASLASCTFKRGIILEIDFDEFPIFGEIEHVFCKSESLTKLAKSDLAIIVKIFIVVCQNDHKQSHEVEDSLTYRFIKIDSTTLLKHTIMVTGSNGELYIPFD